MTAHTTMQTIEAVYTFTEGNQHFAKCCFVSPPSEAEAVYQMLQKLNPDQRKKLVKVELYQVDAPDPIDWLYQYHGNYHFKTVTPTK